ncbi:MAG: hypothetical protein JXX14_08550, partial [Deltaproteobacteria bacterium]|nr:hypothetical protein [Deltaproteobacteria bacterium]
MTSGIHANISRAVNARRQLFVPPHDTAFRLFNGFAEGNKNYIIDVFGRSAVINDYSSDTDTAKATAIAEQVRNETGFIDTAIHKIRKAHDAIDRNGIL